MILDTETRLTTWTDEFSTWLSTAGRSPATVKSYLSDLAVFTRWYQQANGQLFTPDLTTGVDLRLYRAQSLAAGKIKPATWNRRCATLGVFCQWLLTSGQLTYNPFQGVEPWPEDDLPPRWLDAREFSRFMRQIEININGAKTAAWKRQAIRDAAIVSLMVYAGLREAEVVALNVGDLSLTARKGKVIIRRGKGDKRREIPLSSEARRALGEWLAVRVGAGDNTAGLDQPAGHAPLPMPLFDGKGAHRLTTRSIQRRISEIGRQAGVTVAPHDLRHTFAKRLLDAGRPLTVVSKLLGHSRLETTARYVQPGWADFENAVEGL